MCSSESPVDLLIAKLAIAREKCQEDSKQQDGVSAVPDHLLTTDIVLGLTEIEVQARRKAWGRNVMKAEKNNKVLEFIKYFIGPIQFVMEVCPVYP